MSDFKQLSDEELEQVTGGIDWRCFGQCLLDFGLRTRPEYAHVIPMAENVDCFQLAMLIASTNVLDDPMFAECWNAC